MLRDIGRRPPRRDLADRCPEPWHPRCGHEYGAAIRSQPAGLRSAECGFDSRYSRQRAADIWPATRRSPWGRMTKLDWGKGAAGQPLGPQCSTNIAKSAS